MDGVTRRGFLRAAGGAGAAIALGGCGVRAASMDELAGQGRRAAAGGVTYDGPPVRLDFWTGFTGGDGPFMLEFVDAFNAAQDRITVRMNVILWVDYYQKTTAAVASGQGPDMGVMQVDQIPTAAAHRVIVPLDEVATAMRLRGDDFASAVWDASVVGGRRFGIPLDVHPLGLYVNEDVLRRAGLEPRAPQDRREYEQALAALRERGIRGAWVSPFPFTGVLQFQSLLAQFGGSMYDADAARATWASDAGVEALGFMRSLVDRGYSARNVGQDADAIAFKNGENAFLWNGCWAINEYAGVEGLKTQVAPLPRIGPRAAAWGNSHNFVLMRQAAGDEHRLQAATAFFDFVSTRSLTWADSGMIPARRSVLADPAFRELEAQSTFARQLPEVVFTPPVPGIEDVRELTLDSAVNTAILGKAAPREALRDAARRADALLADNRAKYGVTA